MKQTEELELGDFVPGLWIDPSKPLPKMPQRRVVTSGVRITGLPWRSEARLNGAYVTPVRRPNRAALFLPLQEPVLYQQSRLPLQLYSATDDIKAPVATQLLLYLQRAAVEHLSCAGRMAGGDAPDWCWFKQGVCDVGYKPDGSFAIETRYGLLVGNVYSQKPRLLRTAAAIRAWSVKRR